jgi:hypothetical protein
MADRFNVLLYCDFRAPSGDEIKEHWKPEIPDVGLDEVVHDFYVVVRQGGKRLFHCLMQSDEDNPRQFQRIKTYIENFNIGKPVNERILYWFGNDALGAYRSLWQDRTTHAFIEAIAVRVIQYPIRHFTGHEDHPIKATVNEAETVWFTDRTSLGEDDYSGITVQNSVLQTCGERCIPHKFFGV